MEEPTSASDPHWIQVRAKRKRIRNMVEATVLANLFSSHTPHPLPCAPEGWRVLQALKSPTQEPHHTRGCGSPTTTQLYPNYYCYRKKKNVNFLKDIIRENNQESKLSSDKGFGLMLWYWQSQLSINIKRFVVS